MCFCNSSFSFFRERDKSDSKKPCSYNKTYFSDIKDLFCSYSKVI